MIWMVFGLLGCNLQAAGDQPRAATSVRLVLPADASPVARNLGTVLTRQVQQRCDAKVGTGGDAKLMVEMAIEQGIGKEGFRIEDRPGGGVRIVGNDERGLVAGAGKFLRTSRYDQGGFTPGAWRGTSVPTRQARGIYFATHFHNFYHEAPVPEIERYVEDLALWGLNELVVWYDAHHFNGFEDPEAVKFRKRLHDIMAAAKGIGMDVSLVFPGNEAYGNSPAELRAAPGGGRGGYYPCAVCPSKPEGMKYILKVLGEEFDWAADLRPRSVWIWPYDQGGCGCAECKPWGCKGFMKCVEEVGNLARQVMPGTKILLSTWYMDQTELASVMKQLGERNDLVDGLVNEGNVLPAASGLGGVDQTPGGPRPVLRQDLPVVGFPEISMHNTFPWGGFGATPLTARAQGQWNAQKQGLAGGYPYSEGIYEDLTKIVYSQFYWNDQAAAETVKEYISFEFSPDVVADAAGVIKTLEQNHHMRWWPGKLEGVPLEMNWFPSKGAKPQADQGAEEAYAAMQRIDGLLTPQAKNAWRWRQLYLRALLDSELKTNGGKPNVRCNEAFAELIKIYHAENANPAVRPPLPKDYQGNKSPSAGTVKSRTFNVLNHGAVGDDKTDNTEAFSACLKAVIAAGGGKMFIPDGIYRGRIVIPGTKEWITVEIAGESEPTPVFGTIGSFPLPKSGTIIKCLSESGPAVISTANVPSKMYMQFSGINVSLRNLDVRTYDNPGIGGIDLLNAVQCKLENVFVNTDRYNVDASKPTHSTAGISTPACNNGALTILRNVIVTGYHTGILVNEHTDGDNIVVASNINGLEFVTNHHASRFGRVGTYRNTHHVTVSGRHGFSIEQMNTEQPGPGQTDTNNAWQALVSDINDPKNSGIGDINYWVVEGNVGAVEKFIRNGGASIQARRIGSAPAGSK